LKDFVERGGAEFHNVASDFAALHLGQHLETQKSKLSGKWATSMAIPHLEEGPDKRYVAKRSRSHRLPFIDNIAVAELTSVRLPAPASTESRARSGDTPGSRGAPGFGPPGGRDTAN